MLLDVSGYRLRAFVTNLPWSIKPLEVWLGSIGRADMENQIKERGDQFGIKRLACRGFWSTGALHQMATAAYKLCGLLQRQLGQRGATSSCSR